MARNSDLSDARLRALLMGAEEALDARDFNGSVHKTMAAYTQLIDERPDVIVDPNDRSGAAPSFDRVLARLAPRPWPGDVCGVELIWPDDGKPFLRTAKERFTFSDAVTLMEYTLDTAMRAQRSDVRADS
jgi:hypothetical protein